MFYKRNFVLILLLLVSVFMSYAQNIQDISNIEIDNLPDEKIELYVQRVKEKGYTIEQAVAIAKTKGMSELQSQKLLSRIRNLNFKSSNISNEDDETKETVTKKTEILFGLTGKESKEQKKDKLFGYDFFNNPNISFVPNLNIATPENYILGIGDIISIDLWGASEANYEQKVNKQGAINIPGVGYVSVFSLSVNAARAKIKNSLRKIYSGIGASNSSYNKVHLAISVKEIRNVQVNIIGEVKVPGSYSLNGFSTVLNALYAAGGPTKNGTFRNIQLFRRGKKVADFDFYQFLINGLEKGNITVQDQDVIIVKPYEKQVTIKGAVKRSGVFEMKGNESFIDLLSFCSGFSFNAYKQNVVIERVNGVQKEIVEITPNNFSEEFLVDGDLIKINKISNVYANKISIAGAVFQPGNYQYKKGITLNALLKKAEGYTKEAFLDRGIVVRTYDKTNKETISFSLNESNEEVLLKDNDSIYIYSKEELKEKEFITINGAVNNPNKFNFMRSMKIEDLILLANGLKDGADVSAIDVSRRLKDGSFETISKNYDVDAKQNLEGSSNENFNLEPFDVVSVRYLKGYTKQKTVKIEGEVNYSGVYSLGDKNQKISDLIKQAGGLTKYAYVKGAFLSRKKNTIGDEKQLELIENLEGKDNSKINKNVFFKIGINLEKILSKENSKFNLILEEGDELFIPSERQTVKIEGEVLLPSMVRYEKGKSFKHYIENSGGFSNKAKKSKAYVIYANGDIKTTKTFLFFRSYPDIQPGALILIPNKPENKKKITTQEVLAITTGLATLGVLVKSLTD